MYEFFSMRDMPSALNTSPPPSPMSAQPTWIPVSGLFFQYGRVLTELLHHYRPNRIVSTLVTGRYWAIWRAPSVLYKVSSCVLSLSDGWWPGGGLLNELPWIPRRRVWRAFQT